MKDARQPIHRPSGVTGDCHHIQARSRRRKLPGMKGSKVLFYFGVLFCVSKKPSGVHGQSVLVWEDNFDGTSLNDTVWTLDTGNGCDQGDGLCGWGNFEQQTYTLGNHRVADGVLTITADKEMAQVDERWYTSSRIRSKSPFAFLTGRIEARIRLPQGLGLWAAFWMLPSNSSRGEWAATGEIDIMEAVNDMDTVIGTIHYGGEYPENRFAGCRQSSGMDFSSDYHVYALEWEVNEMRWFIDEQLFCLRTRWTSDVESIEPYHAPFDTEFELLLNLAVGGQLPGRFVDDDIFPATMWVDYMRVYDMSGQVEESGPFLGAPLCLPGVLQAEAFDVGGLGLGYGDTQPTGGSAAYRTDGAGLVGTNSERTFVANLTEGAWTSYRVMTDEAVYNISLEYSASAAADIQLIIGDGATCGNPEGFGGAALTAVLAARGTGVSGEWGTLSITDVSIPAGSYRLKICVSGGTGINLDSLTFDLVPGSTASSLTSVECASSTEGRPYMFGTPWAIPGYIEVENYDYGGQGVGFYENTPTSNFGDSGLRLPDGVDVIEAESNPAHGHYIGDWQPGEWLAFTSHAEEGGYWDVGASVASGANGTTIIFRILVNATNCSSLETDGFDGLGAEGVDLLDGPVYHDDTDSWEGFEFAMRPDVWVPEGIHRVMFCADSELFNVNYLRFFTPMPTPAPTPVPSPAPTNAPTVPDDDGVDTKWIYISVVSVLALTALSRLGWIIYTKEGYRRRKPATFDDFDSSETSRDNGESVSATDKKASSTDTGRVDLLVFSKEVGLSSKGIDTLNAQPIPVAKQNRVVQNIFDAPPLVPGARLQRRSSMGDQPYRSRASQRALRSSRGLWRDSRGGRMTPDLFRSVPGEMSVPKIQPLVSPVESAVSYNSSAVYGARPTPRTSAGLEVFASGSLWDRATQSPVRRDVVAPGSGTGSTAGVSRRDQFEDALLRAVENKWDSSSKFSETNPMRAMSRSSSFTEGAHRKNAMLAAGKCWTCQCSFENSVGQNSCLGCGRVAPLRRPSGSGEISGGRKALPPHRMHSWIAPPTDV